MNHEIADFQTEVIERSYTVPVLVDFWAEWCGPCKVLGPILERLAAKDGSQWVLAKVDTDKHQDLAAQYGIRGIPNVKLFVDGKIANEFTGALPEPAVVQWLKKALPNKFRKDIEKAQQLQRENNNEAAQALLEQIIQQDPSNEHARVLLGGILVPTDPERALALVSRIEESSEFFPMVDAIRTFSELSTKVLHPEKLPDDPVKDEYLVALKETIALRYDSALERFIDVIRDNRYYDDDSARKTCIAIFRILGDDHKVTQKRRREFSSALYS